MDSGRRCYRPDQPSGKSVDRVSDNFCDGTGADGLLLAICSEKREGIIEKLRREAELFLSGE